MARRSKIDEAGVNLDSLMDALTNVVGILIIVFILVQLNVAEAVQKVLSDLRQVTSEELQGMQTDHESVSEQLVQVIGDWEEAEEAAPVVAESLKLKNLEEEGLRKQAYTKVEFEERNKLLAEIAQLEKELIPVREKELELGSERERLAALLANVKPVEEIAALEIRMPNPRPIPENALVYNFWVAPDRIVYLNEKEYLEQFEEEFERIRREVKVSERPGRGNDAKPIPIYDATQTADYMKDKGRLGSRDVVSEIVVNPTSTRLTNRLSIAEEGGETIAEIRSQASTFQRALRKIKSEPNSIVMFHVDRAAIETYLTVRRYADAVEVPAGWKMHWTPFYQQQVVSIEVQRLKEPPPPKEGATFRVDAPKDGLD